MLKWDPLEFVDFLGTLPVEGEDGISHIYEVKKHGLRLSIHVYQYDGDVYIQLHRDGVEHAILDFRIQDSDAARRVKDKRGDYFEFAAGRLFGGRYDGDAPIPYGLRIKIDPDIHLSFFRTSA